MSVLSRHLRAPSQRHTALLKRVFRNLTAIEENGLIFKANYDFCPESLVAYADANWRDVKILPSLLPDI